MNWSRIIGILSLIAAGATAGATVVDAINPKWAAMMLAAAAAINAFTERVQGGVSKIESKQ